MGRHRSSSSTRRVSRGFIAAVAAVLLVIVGVAGWVALRGHTSGEGGRAAGACVAGDITVPVAAAPSIAPVLTDLARSYGDTAPVVRDHCVRVQVTPTPDADALAALTGGGGQAPALWVPESSLDVGALRGAAPDRIDGDPVSLAASPVVLAAPQAQAQGIGTPAWADLPRLQSTGALGLAMPGGAGSAATPLTLAAAVAGAGADPAGAALAAADLSSPAGAAAVSGLVDGAPGDRSAATADVLGALRAGTAPAGVRAVPATEQQLYAAQRQGGGAALAAVRPTGPTPLADYPAVRVRTDAGADARDLSAAAGDFLNYAANPRQAARFVEAGFLVAAGGGAQPPADADGIVSPAPPAQVLPGPADDASAALLSATAAAPATTAGTPSPPAGAASTSGATTVLLDVSGSMAAAEGGRSRLANVVAALDTRLQALPDADSTGLWTYSAALSGSTPYRIIVPTGPLGEDVGGGTTRRQAIVTGLDAATPRTATHTYRSLQAAYTAAVQGYTDGADNSVLLITDGPNDDESYRSTQALLDAIAQAGDPARPVAVNVIVLGPNEDIASLRAVADATGGTVTTVASSADPELGQAVADLLR